MERRTFLKNSVAAALAVPALAKTNEEVAPGMFVHCVYFWMRDDLTAEQIQSFEKGLQSLAAIDSVKAGYIGTPAGTDRSIIDQSYSYALVLVFEDPAAQDAYQVDPVHETFRQQTTGFWKDIKIYDVLTT